MHPIATKLCFAECFGAVGGTDDTFGESVFAFFCFGVAIIAALGLIDHAIAAHMNGTFGFLAIGITHLTAKDTIRTVFGLIIAVVAHFSAAEHKAITTTGKTTGVRTGVGVYSIAVIAILTQLKHAIPTAHQHTIGRAVVIVDQVAIIAGLTRIGIEHAIAAVAESTRGGDAVFGTDRTAQRAVGAFFVDTIAIVTNLPLIRVLASIAAVPQFTLDFFAAFIAHRTAGKTIGAAFGD